MRSDPGPQSDMDRLHSIVRAFRDCDETPTAEGVAKQFKYETRRNPPADLLMRALALKPKP